MGPGIEFADYRTYGPGDDARRIDPAVHARLGQFVVRDNVVERAVPVRIVVDLTGSMAGKGRWIRELAAALAYVVASADDPVRIASFRGGDGGRVEWSPLATGVRRLEPLLAWLDAQPSGGSTALEPVVRRLPTTDGDVGPLVVISDAWFPDLQEGLRRLLRSTPDVFWIVPLDAAERDPSRLGFGAIRLIDAESGREVDAVVDEETVAAIRRRTERHHDLLRRELAAVGGGMATVPVEDPVLNVFSRSLVRAGLVG